MKRFALVLFLLVTPILAAEKQVIPDASTLPVWGHWYCIQVKGIEQKTCICASPDPLPAETVKFITRENLAYIGLAVGGEIGSRITAAAPYLAFPELGDSVTKETPAVAYCSTSNGSFDLFSPFDVSQSKATGRGGCSDFLTVYLRKEVKLP